MRHHESYRKVEHESVKINTLGSFSGSSYVCSSSLPIPIQKKHSCAALSCCVQPSCHFCPISLVLGPLFWDRTLYCPTPLILFIDWTGTAGEYWSTTHTQASSSSVFGFLWGFFTGFFKRAGLMTQVILSCRNVPDNLESLPVRTHF